MREFDKFVFLSSLRTIDSSYIGAMYRGIITV